MKDIWLKFACFLTGYKYSILRHASAASVKYVRKTLSAFFIICILWAYIGFTFGSLYFGLNSWESGILSAILVFVIIQIERQITLTTDNLRKVGWFRAMIGIIMAIIGSIATDQILFHGDIEKNRPEMITNEDIEADPKMKNLNAKIQEAEDSKAILNENNTKLLFEYSNNPKIDADARTIITFDTLGRKEETIINIPKEDNPLKIIIDSTNNRIIRKENYKRQLLTEKDSLNETIKQEKIANFGPIEDLNVLIYTFSKNIWSLIFWLSFFILFFFLELLVLINKKGEKHTDYFDIIQHQVAVKRKLLKSSGV